MPIFSKKDDKKEDFQDYSTMPLPFISQDIIENNNEEKSVKVSASSSNTVKNAEPDDIKVIPSGVSSPIDNLKKTLAENTAEISEEISDITDDTPKPDINTVEESKSGAQAPSERPSLLKRCMPYIYDDQGVSQADAKPDYVLESVEDIIRSAEERAAERIAEHYKLTDSKGRRLKIEKVETVGKPISTPEETPSAKPVKKEESIKTGISEKVGILFDDFSGKQTVVTEGDTVTTPYSKLTVLQAGIPVTPSQDTIVVPDIKKPKKETMEDIVSHTRPVNISDAPAIKPQKPVAITVKSEELIPEVDDDYRTTDDTKRIGMKLKKSRRSAFFRLTISVLCAIASAIFVTIVPSSVFSDIPFVPSLIQFGLLSIVSFANVSVFTSFKTMFTKKSTAASPIALAATAMLVYMVLGLILGYYPSNPALVTVLALVAYDFFEYKRATDILNNFRIVASRSQKKAITLIDDQNVASSMARSSIDGEVLAVGVKRTAVPTDFIKHTSCDLAFNGQLGIILIVFLAISVVFALITGISYGSFDTALCVAALTLSIFAMPSYSFAEFEPLCSLSRKLYRVGAMICGKRSASRIEQANAVVVTSSELFPDGSIEFYNIKPLSANNIDRTLVCASSIAEAIGSPLVSVFNTFINPDEEKPAADTIKYEDNLGISGWVDDKHYFIGNRTLMEAHGIKVPPLEVDRKILHRGYFPVYVAEGQRACALLIVKYIPDKRVRNNLVKLANAGITLLIDNCDSNITADMLSDYYDIYADSIKIMDHKGVHNYQATVSYSEFFSTHAAFIGKSDAYFAIVSGALKLRTVSNIIYALHIVLASVLSVVFILSALDGRMTLMSIPVLVLLELIALLVCAFTHLFTKQ